MEGQVDLPTAEGVGLPTAGSLQHRFEDGAEVEEVLEAGGFLEVATGAEASGIGAIPRRVGGAENDHGDGVKSRAAADAFEHLAAGALGQIEIENHQVGAIPFLDFEGLHEANRAIAIGNEQEFARDAVFLKGLTD